MIKPSEKVIRAMLNLENNLSWQEIVSWIEESLLAQSIANNNSIGEQTIKNQGRNQELAEIVKHIKNRNQYQENIVK
jgi:hypothetical protein